MTPETPHTVRTLCPRYTPSHGWTAFFHLWYPWCLVHPSPEDRPWWTSRTSPLPDPPSVLPPHPVTSSSNLHPGRTPVPRPHSPPSTPRATRLGSEDVLPSMVPGSPGLVSGVPTTPEETPSLVLGPPLSQCTGGQDRRGTGRSFIGTGRTGPCLVRLSLKVGWTRVKCLLGGLRVSLNH